MSDLFYLFFCNRSSVFQYVLLFYTLLFLIELILVVIAIIIISVSNFTLVFRYIFLLDILHLFTWVFSFGVSQSIYTTTYLVTFITLYTISALLDMGSFIWQIIYITSCTSGSAECEAVRTIGWILTVIVIFIFTIDIINIVSGQGLVRQYVDFTDEIRRSIQQKLDNVNFISDKKNQ